MTAAEVTVQDMTSVNFVRKDFFGVGREYYYFLRNISVFITDHCAYILYWQRFLILVN